MYICFFILLFVKGHFTCKFMEIGIIEGAITLIFKHFMVHFNL